MVHRSQHSTSISLNKPKSQVSTVVGTVGCDCCQGGPCDITAGFSNPKALQEKRQNTAFYRVTSLNATFFGFFPIMHV